MSSKSLPLAVIPLQVRRQECNGQEEGQPSEIQTPGDSQLSCSPFRLPDDWIVEEKPRSSYTGNRRYVDRYYYEPGTGRMFRSLVSVQRHLTEESREAKRVKSNNEDTMQAENQTRGGTSSFRLPDDWIVEEKPHKYIGVKDRAYIEPETGQRFRSLIAVQRYLCKDNGLTSPAKMQAETQTRGSTSSFRLPDDWIVEEKQRKYSGFIYRTYIEPETGRRFRSLIAVQRYLSEDNGFTVTAKPLLKHGSEKLRASSEKCAKAVSKCSKAAEEEEIPLKSLKRAAESKNSKKSDSPKKINLEKDNNASMVNLSSPPAKVKWVLSGTGGFWTPFLDGSTVPESVKQKWSNAFISYIQDGVTN